MTDSMVVEAGLFERQRLREQWRSTHPNYPQHMPLPTTVTLQIAESAAAFERGYQKGFERGLKRFLECSAFPSYRCPVD